MGYPNCYTWGNIWDTGGIMMRIWFNHWFSTAYHLINMIKDGDPGKFYFIGTSTNPVAMYKKVCDEWYEEKDGMNAEEYIAFCLEFCKEHKVDVFVPRRYLVEVVKHREKFEEIGVKVFAHNDSDIIVMLDDKQKTYEHFREIDTEIIPEICIAHSFDEFCNCYEKLQKLYERVCYKLVIDEGARSFRVIDNNINTLKGVLEKPGSKVTYEMAKQILSQYDFENPMLLMPYLSGVEISVDCLATPSGNLIIPRYKTNKRYSEVIFGKEIMQKCDHIMNCLGVKMPMNIQFKINEGKLYLLEINPRMSGGLQLSCKATGINLPSIAMNQLLGKNIEWEYPQFDSRKVAHIETPVIVG